MIALLPPFSPLVCLEEPSLFLSPLTVQAARYRSMSTLLRPPTVTGHRRRPRGLGTEVEPKEFVPRFGLCSSAPVLGLVLWALFWVLHVAIHGRHQQSQPRINVKSWCAVHLGSNSFSARSCSAERHPTHRTMVQVNSRRYTKLAFQGNVAWCLTANKTTGLPYHVQKIMEAFTVFPHSRNLHGAMNKSALEDSCRPYALGLNLHFTSPPPRYINWLPPSFEGPRQRRRLSVYLKIQRIQYFDEVGSRKKYAESRRRCRLDRGQRPEPSQ